MGSASDFIFFGITSAASLSEIDGVTAGCIGFSPLSITYSRQYIWRDGGIDHSRLSYGTSIGPKDKIKFRYDTNVGQISFIHNNNILDQNTVPTATYRAVVQLVSLGKVTILPNNY